MTTKREHSDTGRTSRFVHLGERLLAIEQIRRGTLTMEEAAESLGVARDEIAQWQRQHAGERHVSFDELRSPRARQALRLERRVRMLARLVADSEKQLRELHQELLHPSELSKQIAGKHHRHTHAVASTQPEVARRIKFVDGGSSR
jgi:transposase-like protein